MSIRDFGSGFTQSTLEQLGISPVSSEQGFSMAVLLSHASLERLGGRIALTNHQQGGAKVVLTMPLAKKRGSFSGEEKTIAGRNNNRGQPVFKR